jgi:hypothetical protein
MNSRRLMQSIRDLIRKEKDRSPFNATTISRLNSSVTVDEAAIMLRSVSLPRQGDRRLQLFGGCGYMEVA